MPNYWSSAKDIVEVVGGGIESLAILAAGWWFLYTTQFKPRIQFDLDCRFFPLDQNPNTYLAEISFIFENKGFVEHRLYDLSLSIHGLGAGTHETSRLFVRRLFPKTMIVPPRYNWYFVRPGVRQVIVHEVIVENPGALVQVTSGFSYERRAQWPHTARRVFTVPFMSRPAVEEEAPVSPGLKRTADVTA